MHSFNDKNACGLLISYPQKVQTSNESFQYIVLWKSEKKSANITKFEKLKEKNQHREVEEIIMDW